MDNSFITEIFDISLEKYLNNIESLWTSLPLVINTIKQAQQTAIEEFNDFIDNYCKPEKENHYIIPEEHYRKFLKVKKLVDNSATAVKLIERNFLVSLICQFDTYVSDLIKAIYTVRPEILNTSEKQFSFAELKNFKNIQDATEYIIEKEIETVLRGSYTEQFEWFEGKLKIQLRKDLPIWETFVEITQRRNLFVHNDGKVLMQYLNVCNKNNIKIDDNVIIGYELSIDEIYLNIAFECLYEIGIKLNQVIRRKLVPEEIEKADISFLNISFDLIYNEKYELAKTLYDFSDKYIKKYSSEDLRLRILINRAQTYKWLNNEEECKKIINSIDWSATDNTFKLVRNVLLNEFEKAAQMMYKIGNSPDAFTKVDYKDWPVFKMFILSDYFKKAYFEIYKFEFEILEEKI